MSFCCLTNIYWSNSKMTPKSYDYITEYMTKWKHSLAWYEFLDAGDDNDYDAMTIALQTFMFQRTNKGLLTKCLWTVGWVFFSRLTRRISEGILTKCLWTVGWVFFSRLTRRISEGILTKCLWTVGWVFFSRLTRRISEGILTKCLWTVGWVFFSRPNNTSPSTWTASCQKRSLYHYLLGQLQTKHVNTVYRVILAR